MKRFIFLAAIAFVISSPVSADEDLVLIGAGTTSCGKFLDSQGDKFAISAYNTWSQGFLSALNVSGDLNGQALVSLPDVETINAYTVKYCRENPLESVFVGVLHMYGELRIRSATDIK